MTTSRPIEGLDGLRGVHAVHRDDASVPSGSSSSASSVHLEVDSAELAGVMTHLSTFGIVSLVSRPPTLEELFMRHYGDDVRVPDQHRDAGVTGVTAR